MRRIALTDDSGKWFNLDKVEKFDEATEWNGNNNISKATKSQWEHESLYRTASGKWIKNSWSQMQGSLENYQEITDEEAAKWLVINEHDSPIVEQQIKDLEL